MCVSIRVLVCVSLWSYACQFIFMYGSMCVIHVSMFSMWISLTGVSACQYVSIRVAISVIMPIMSQSPCVCYRGCQYDGVNIGLSYIPDL